MKVKRFEDLIAWQKAQDLAVDVFNAYRDLRDFSFKDQIWRAAVSISNNISEGFKRRTTADFTHFLTMARTSNNEVKSMTYLACRVGYITEAQKLLFLARTEEESKIINALIAALNRKN